MKKAMPKWDVLQEYVLHNGIEWVMEEYDLSFSQIQDKLYSVSVMPTPESDKRLKAKVLKEDLGEGKYRVLKEFFIDSFNEDKVFNHLTKNGDQVRRDQGTGRYIESSGTLICSKFIDSYKRGELRMVVNKDLLRISEYKNIVDDCKPEVSDEYKQEVAKLYVELMDRDMKRVGNQMKPHGWVMGERVINQTTAKTTDDNISELCLSLLKEERYLTATVNKTESFIVVRHLDGVTNENIVNIDDIENDKDDD